MDVVTHHKHEKKNDGPLLKVGSHAAIGTSLREVPSTVPNRESILDLCFNTDVPQALYQRGNRVPGNNLKRQNRRDYVRSVQTTRHYLSPRKLQPV